MIGEPKGQSLLVIKTIELSTEFFQIFIILFRRHASGLELINDKHD